VHPDLERVRELQDLDRRIGELTREISYLPRHVADIENKLESHRRKLEADRAALVANQKERRRLEDDVKAQEDKMAHLRNQMHESKTNEQYRAFQHEIEYLQGGIRKLEDRILEQMVEAESFDQNARAAETALQQESQEVEKEKKAAGQRTEADRAELVVVQARREVVAQAADSRTLTLYERVRKQRGGVAVSVARDGRCTTCNVILRLHFYQQVRVGEEVLTCEACGRILYYLALEEPKEAPDCSVQTAEPRP